MEYMTELLKKWEYALLGYAPKIVFAIIVLTVSYFIGKFLKKISLKFYLRVFRAHRDIAQLVSASLNFLVLLFGVFLSLEILGLEGILSKMLAGAGIVGLLAGFAFQEIASNFLAGFFINIQRPFKTEDWVEINGIFGRVLTIGGFTTTIKTITGQKVFVPNNIIYKDSFTNYSAFSKRRVVFQSGVSYGDNLDLVKKAALEEAAKVDLVLKNENIDFYFTSIGSSTYNFEVRFWIKYTDQEDYLAAMDEIIMRIKKRFEAEDISLAYSITTLDFGVKGGVNLFDKPLMIKSSENEVN